jgi:deazaflavin-dependent oxidoreductase (nitroreductase family)
MTRPAGRSPSVAVQVPDPRDHGPRRRGPVPLPWLSPVVHSGPMDAETRPRRTLAATLRGRLVNPVVRCLLRSPGHRVLSGSVLLLTYTGRRSGARRELPVMYAVLDDRYLVVAGQPEAKTWWRNFTGDVRPVTVTVAGRRESCRARLVGPGTSEYHQAVVAYRQRYPRVPVGDSAPVLSDPRPRRLTDEEHHRAVGAVPADAGRPATVPHRPAAA